MKKPIGNPLKMITLGILFAFSLAFCGCSRLLSELSDLLPPDSEELSESAGLQEETPPEYTHGKGDLSSILYDGVVPLIHNDEEFNLLMNHHLTERVDSFHFYALDSFSIDHDLLLYRFSLPYVSTDSEVCPDGRVYWTIYLTYYPGTLIADAYVNNSPEQLDQDQQTVYRIAKEYIETEVASAPDILSKERLIHDYICRIASYTNPVSDEPVPRHCTAVGLLLDGEANCQGYTDCFYMLATMAGLHVDKQSGSAEDSLHVWNIIEIDGTWYSMDLTYDDTTFMTDGSGYPAYIYFNAGGDILYETHRIPSGNERVPISSVSDENYFYNVPGFACTGSSDDPDSSMRQIADLLVESYNGACPFVSFRLMGTLWNSADVANDIQYLIADRPCPITITTFTVGNDTYILGEPY